MGQYRFALLLAVVCRRGLSSSVTLPACGPAGRRAHGNAAWERCQRSGWPATGRVGGRAADTARRASTVTSSYGDTLFHTIITTNKHPFNGLFSRTTWVIWHQKGKPFWVLMRQVAEASAGLHANYLHLAPDR